MVVAAKADGIDLKGWSFRSYERQQELFEKNCISGTCRPPTAQPGNSMHERGLATDFSKGSSVIRASDPEYKWLQNNAAKYGYFNFPAETWHWSTSGN